MDILAPLFPAGLVSVGTALVVALLVGIVFGWILQRAGFGSARILMAQFFLTDLRLLRVLFTAILTALVGLWALTCIGFLDWTGLFRVATAVWPQALGGVIFGVGFLLGGYCPGTTVVAIVNGRWDGLACLFGLVVGTVLVGAASPWVDPWMQGHAVGTVTLPEALHLPTGWVVLGVTALGAAVLVAADWWEARRKGSLPTSVIAATPWSGRLVLGGLLGVACLTAWQPEPIARTRSLIASSTIAAVLAEQVPTMSPTGLAEALMGNPEAYRILDLRTQVTPAERFPGAEAATPEAVAIASWPVAASWVILADTDAHAQQACLLLRMRGVRSVAVLAGGWVSWRDQVVNPVLPRPDSASDAGHLAAVVRRSELAKHFGGMPIFIDAPLRSGASPWGEPGSSSPPPAPGSHSTAADPAAVAAPGDRATTVPSGGAPIPPFQRRMGGGCK